MTEWKTCAATVLACCLVTGVAVAQAETDEAPSPLEVYQQTLAEGRFHTGETLSVADVAYSFDKNLAGRDSRESAHIVAWHGVHQSGDVATVLYSISAMDVVFSHENVAMAESLCRHLNDGRWFCRVKIDGMKLDAAFYIETPTEAELAAQAQAEAAASTRTLTPPRP